MCKRRIDHNILTIKGEGKGGKEHNFKEASFQS